MNHPLITHLLAGLVLGVTALAGENDKKTVAPLTPVDDGWRFKLSMPGWITWVEGDTGVNGVVSHIDLGPNDLVPRIDVAAGVGFEAGKGHFSVFGEFIYASLSDGIGSDTVVKKLDVQVDQTMGDLGLAWRLIDSPQGYLDVTGGVRYTNLYQKVALQANDERIDEVARGLATAGTLLRLRLAKELAVLSGKDASLPIAPLGGGEAARLATAIAKIRGNTAERQAKIARLLEDALGRTISRTDDWWDPYVGLRGRYNFSSSFYLIARAEIGGFGVGSDLMWQAQGAFGVQLTRSVFAEAGYRALSFDYDHNGLTYDMITHGPQMTLGVEF